MATTYEALKAANPAETKRLIEVTGHLLAGSPGERAEWCLRIGIPIDEFDRIVREYDVARLSGQRTAHTRQL